MRAREVTPELVAEVLTDDADAFDRWFRAEHPVVYRLCLGFLADPGAADDLAQDAMLHLKDRLDTYDPTKSWESWRTRVVLNLCRDRLRRDAARRRAEETSEERAAYSPTRESASPGAAAENADLRRLVADCLTALSPREREAFVLRDLVGHTTAAAARAMGVEESSVRALVAVARRRVRERLAPRLSAELEGGAS